MCRRNAFFAALVAGVLFTATFAGAADTVIKGIVTDSNGKPVRGAIVKATLDIKSISRFTQSDGRYEIAVAPGIYAVSADAFGLAVKQVSVDTAKGGDTNFSLSPAPLELSRLTGAELESILPASPAKTLISSRCIQCHAFPTVLHRQGSTAEEWREFLPAMARGSQDEPFGKAPPATLDAISAALGKTFGPDSSQISLDAYARSWSEVKHSELSDDALRATVVEYRISKVTARPHSIEIDAKNNIAWFGEQSYFANKAASFDIATETLHEYPLTTGHARPHTGGIAADGTYWVALSHANDPAKLASVNPKTGEVKEYNWPEKAAIPGHTLVIDRAGIIWLTGSPTGEIWAFNTETKQFKAYNNPPPTIVPKGSVQDLQQSNGEARTPPDGTTYDAAVDSKGMVWFSEVAVGTLVRLNPATGEVKDYRPEGVVNIRGITIDPQDNLWFGDFLGHRLGKMNVKTGAVKFYNPPTPNATVYGETYNPVDGNIWLADMNGNNITRFNPKTEKFTEFPIPSRPDRSYARFIATDARGRVWFTEYFGDRIGYVDPTGGEDSRHVASLK
jgi:streptogramin lyase